MIDFFVLFFLFNVFIVFIDLIVFLGWDFEIEILRERSVLQSDNDP